jgi:hypothetical protein
MSAQHPSPGHVCDRACLRWVRDFGRRFSWCLLTTPVVVVDVAKMERAMARGRR